MELLTFPAQIVRVVDGDSFTVDVDLRWGRLWVRGQEVRLKGCNAREHSEAGGPEATANLAQLLRAGTLVTLSAMEADKFGGRIDALVTLASGQDLTQLLIAQQWAAPWNGRGPKPVPPWPRTIGS